MGKELVGKKATIAVEGLEDKGLHIEDNVEILDQEEVEEEVLGETVRKVKIKVRHLDFEESEGWIDTSEVVNIRD